MWASEYFLVKTFRGTRGELNLSWGTGKHVRSPCSPWRIVQVLPTTARLSAPPSKALPHVYRVCVRRGHRVVLQAPKPRGSAWSIMDRPSETERGAVVLLPPVSVELRNQKACVAIFRSSTVS